MKTLSAPPPRFRFGLVALAVIAAGAGGFLVRSWWPAAAVDAANNADDAPAPSVHSARHLDLSKDAMEALGVRLGTVEVGDFEQTVRVPAEVVEYPGVSSREMAAPVSGVVVSVAAQQGAVVEPGDVLFEIRVTDQQVINAQLRLVEALTRRDIVVAELKRLEPLAASGAVRGSQRLQLEYEHRELETTIGLSRDELIVRGLSEAHVAAIEQTKRLVRTVVVSVPGDAVPEESLTSDRPAAVQPVAWEEGVGAEQYSIEDLGVDPGQKVQQGVTLCILAAHDRLYLRGQALETDLPLLMLLSRDGRELAAEFGHSIDKHEPTTSLVTGLQVRYVDNHLEEESRTYSFFLPLDNEVLNETSDSAGNRYRTWRFSVGQRAHVLLPTKTIEGQLTLPAEAVAIDGPRAFVFAPEVDSPGGHVHGEHVHWDGDDAVLEFDAIEVKLLARDSQQAVVATGGQLAAGDTIAVNAAYQLLLALESDSGGGHAHDHEH